MARGTVRVRGRGRVRGGYFLLHIPFSVVGLARWPFSVIVNHNDETGRYASRSAWYLVETEMVLPMTLTNHNYH